MDQFKLFMVMLGCKPKGRFTEQHDIFFGIGNSLKDLLPQMTEFWSDSGELHIDAWREVTSVNGHSIKIIPGGTESKNQKQLYFLNLGGYRANEFEEYHYKILAVADALSDAVKESKTTAFYKHFGFKGATSHIDDKYGIDIDDVYKVEDILPSAVKAQFQLKIMPEILPEDELHIGYLKLSKL